MTVGGKRNPATDAQSSSHSRYSDGANSIQVDSSLSDCHHQSKWT